MPELATADALNLVQADRRKGVVSTMVNDLVFFQHVFEKGGITTKYGGGSSIEFIQHGQAPATGIGLYAGTEAAPIGRTQILRKGQTELHHMMVVIAIPNQDLITNSGPSRVEEMWKVYTEATVTGTHRDIETFWHTGVSEGNVFSTAALSGLLSGNGQFTGGLRIGVENGMLEYRTPALQSAGAASFMGITRSTTYNWYNNFGLVTTIDTDFHEVFGKTIREASRFAGKANAPYIAFADPTSFGKLHAWRYQPVRVTSIDQATERDNFHSVKIGSCTFYEARDIDITLFSGDAANGVVNGYNLSDIEITFAEMPKLSNYEKVVINQDVLACSYMMRLQFLVKNLPSHWALAGTAR